LIAIVLAGGFGTRLKSVVKDVPKPLAPINNRAFLEYLFDYLRENGIKKVILSVGYRADLIQNHFGSSYRDISIEYIFEDTPLGTGGAIKKSLESVKESCNFILNGDSFFNIDLRAFKESFDREKADISIALKEMQNFDRYGLIELNQNRVVEFKEKSFCKKGYINAGIYLVKSDILQNFESKSFSFESDFLQKSIDSLNIRGFKSDGYFIDIGIPEDYERAKEYFR